MDENPSESPVEYWLTHLYVVLGCQCEGCGVEPDLAWAWDEPVAGELDPAERFAINAREYVIGEGWRMIDHMPYCSTCAEKAS